ncbi:MAG: hypothetical protein ACK4Z9_06610 [Thermodesulfovibrionales bacterium]
MEELERFKVMIEHWLEHNREHAQSYKEWAEKAEAMGRKDIATVLSNLSLETARLESLFMEALSLVNPPVA